MKAVYCPWELGTHKMLVTIECRLSNGLPGIIIVGVASKAVDEAKERIRAALVASKLEVPRKRIVINLAPADIPKDSTVFDLGIALAILAASDQLRKSPDDKTGVLGEVGLGGIIRPVRGVIGKLLAGKKAGLTTFIIPRDNLAQAQLVPGITLLPFQTVRELYDFYNAPTDTPTNVTPIRTEHGTSPAGHDRPFNAEQSILAAIRGQAQAKRALEIAAAGGHNIFFNGPPGTGKTMLAKALIELLPPLDHDEVLEVTHLHSLTSAEYETLIMERPFRAPHHSASHVSIIGGGSHLKPGEISLSHRGVLFFDELPEFNRQTLEALRQPLEDRTVTIARAKERAEFPADFIFVATANPCPCGYYGTAKACRCSPYDILRYRRKLSGPILDRIDLYSVVDTVDHRNLLAPVDESVDVELIRRRIVAARQAQIARHKGRRLNSTMTNQVITKHALLTAPAKALLDQAAERLQISARSYIRTIKVARTIADLAAKDSIMPEHIAEALQYRSELYAQQTM